MSFEQTHRIKTTRKTKVGHNVMMIQSDEINYRLCVFGNSLTFKFIFIINQALLMLKTSQN